MKPRILRPYPILALAVTAATAAACGKLAPSEPAPEARPEAEVPLRAPAALDPQATGEAPGAAVWAAYRPPTDADGYPLVGNLIRKGGPSEPVDAGADGGRTTRGDGRR